MDYNELLLTQLGVTNTNKGQDVGFNPSFNRLSLLVIKQDEALHRHLYVGTPRFCFDCFDTSCHSHS